MTMMNLKQPCKEIDLCGEDVALFSPSPFCFTQAWAIKVSAWEGCFKTEIDNV